jgi:uncharacterized protein (DUF305 family)
LTYRTLILTVLALTAISCGRAPAKTDTPPASTVPVVQPGAPGEETRALASAPPAVAPAATAADISFMQGMILHHSQAIAMVDLLKTRTKREDMQLLGKKIEVSQNDEMKMMRGWLIDRHQPAPAQGHDQLMMISGQPMAPMPGMLTSEQMSALGAASGPAFDKLFLAGMIQHHLGALKMVEDLFATPGAGVESVIFDFATHVDSDQRMDISRMRRMLGK